MEKENEKFKTENEALKREIEELKQKMKSIPISQQNQQQQFGSRSTQSLEIIGEIGNSNGVKFYKVLHPTLYMLKEMDNKKTKAENIQQLLDEFKIINILHHPNIIKTYGIFTDDQNIPPSILLEYCSNNLEQVIKSKKFSKVQQVFSVYQIAKAMKYIHSQKIFNPALEPSRIFVSEDGIIKICRFENSQLISSKNTSNDEKLKEMNDIHAFGTIVYFIFSGGKFPEDKNKRIPNNFPILTQQLISACWSSEIESFPSFEIICDVLEQNEFKLASFNDQEIQEVIKKCKFQFY